MPGHRSPEEARVLLLPDLPFVRDQVEFIRALAVAAGEEEGHPFIRKKHEARGTALEGGKVQAMDFPAHVTDAQVGQFSDPSTRV